MQLKSVKARSDFVFDPFLFRTTFMQIKQHLKQKAEVQTLLLSERFCHFFPKPLEKIPKSSYNILRLVFPIAAVFSLFLPVVWSGNPYYTLDNSFLNLASPISKNEHKFILVLESLKRVPKNAYFELK